MPRFRPRFSLKGLLAATAVVATATYFFMLPTIRAERFVRYVRSGGTEQAEATAMLSSGFELKYRSILWVHTYITLEPLTFSELLRCRRTVIVRSRGEDVEFVVTPTTITRGKVDGGGRF